MSNIDIKKLFEDNRYPTGWKAVSLIIYSPIGVILVVIRLFIALQTVIAVSLLPEVSIVKSFVVRSLCVTLGIVVKEENIGNKDETARLIITNHITACDHFAAHLVTGCITQSMWDLPAPLNWALGLRDLGSGREVVAGNVKQLLDKGSAPILFTPEGATTSGRIGLLRFSPWVFGLAGAVQPLVIEARRPSIAQVTLTTLGSGALTDLLWFLFVPYTVFTLRYLPVMNATEGEGEEVLSRLVEKAIADSLRLVTTSHTAADKFELVKRMEAERARAAALAGAPQSLPPHMRAGAPPPSPGLQRLARQVAEVLPDVPGDVILRDLARTRSVDLTISNLLEGVVPYVPLPQVAAPPQAPATLAAPATTTVLPSTSQGALDTSASSFARSAQERMLSFHERKAKLIEGARKRYVDRHNLQLAGYNC